MSADYERRGDNPHEGHHDAAGCREVLERIYFFIDNELDHASRAEIEKHLAACAPCLREVDLERIVKALIARSCREHAPVELRQRVMFSIRQVQLELGRESPFD